MLILLMHDGITHSIMRVLYANPIKELDYHVICFITVTADCEKIIAIIVQKLLAFFFCSWQDPEWYIILAIDLAIVKQYVFTSSLI